MRSVLIEEFLGIMAASSSIILKRLKKSYIWDKFILQYILPKKLFEFLTKVFVYIFIDFYIVSRLY